MENKEPMEEKKKLPKGVCPSCWGKKYNSVMKREEGRGDFIGDKNYDSGSYIDNVPCSKCNGTGKYPNQEPMEWESEFDKLGDFHDKKCSCIFNIESNDWEYIDGDCKYQKARKFIKSQIKQAEERGYASGCSNPNYNDGYEEGVKEERDRIMKTIKNIIPNNQEENIFLLKIITIINQNNE